MKFGLIILTILSVTHLKAQNFDGFVVTYSDSLFKGYMKIMLDGGGRKILITDNKKKKPKSFHLTDLKYYSYKRDTFAILRDFYPFDEDYLVDLLEAKVIISKGKLKLYYATLPGYKQQIIMAPSPTGMTAYGQSLYSTYIIKDKENNLIGIKNEKDKFVESILRVIDDNKELMTRIENGELKYRDIKEIIMIYNKQ